MQLILSDYYKKRSFLAKNFKLNSTTEDNLFTEK